jgi:hypothetical protein
MSIKSTATSLAACGLLVCTLSAARAQTTTVVVTTPPPSSPPVTAPAPTPTKLGQGESQISVALAKAELSKLGIRHPSSAQMDAALHGGTVTTTSGTKVQLVGVQTQRASGMGWGQIAHAMGLKLGAVVSASKRAGEHHDHDKNHETHGVKKSIGVDGSAHTQGEGSSHAGGGSGGGGHGGSKK